MNGDDVQNEVCVGCDERRYLAASFYYSLLCMPDSIADTVRYDRVEILSLIG